MSNVGLASAPPYKIPILSWDQPTMLRKLGTETISGGIVPSFLAQVLYSNACGAREIYALELWCSFRYRRELCGSAKPYHLIETLKEPKKVAILKI